MTERTSYKTTLFDRLGPDAAGAMRSTIWGLVLGPVFFLLLIGVGSVHLHMGGWRLLVFALVGGVVIGVAVAKLPVMMGDTAGDVATIMVAGGKTTPYTEQYSLQQAMVMQGRLDDALSSYEVMIAEVESTVDVRIRAAELYSREAKNHVRAAELFRDVIRHPKCQPGEEVYSANRLADLYTGPLGEPGKALVELRRLADRYPNTVVSERALAALRSLKALAREREQEGDKGEESSEEKSSERW
ncbi:MAG TPA: hypothetical protein VIV65_04760 [Gemmatimonadaceae bacterium]